MTAPNAPRFRTTHESIAALPIRLAAIYPNAVFACASNSGTISTMIEGRGPDGALPRECSTDELRIWAELVQAHAAVARGLDNDLRATHGLPLSEFRILLWLTHDPCARMRMAVLADTVQLSPSGLSRAIERLEARGLVWRQQRTDDRRGVDAVLTSAGAVLMRDASETHAAAIERRFFAHLTPEERQAIGSVGERVLAANGQSCGWGSCPATGIVPSAPSATRLQKE